MNLVENQTPVIVVGDGWSAVLSVAQSLVEARSVTWIAGTEAHFASPLPGLRNGADAPQLRNLCAAFGLDLGEWSDESHLRIFKNRTLAVPEWDECSISELCGAEYVLKSSRGGRFDLDLGMIEKALRTAVALDSRLSRIEGIPVESISVQDEGVIVHLANQESVEGRTLIYCGGWSDLPGIFGATKKVDVRYLSEDGSPGSKTKGMTLTDLMVGVAPVGGIQVEFLHYPEHSARLGELQNGVVCSLQKEPNDKSGERHVWGYFFKEGPEVKSRWTVALTPQETENNHEIAKKLRRIKQALNKVFLPQEWLNQGSKDFASTIAQDNVCFAESVFFSGNKIISGISLYPNVDVRTEALGWDWSRSVGGEFQVSMHESQHQSDLGAHQKDIEPRAEASFQSS